METIEKYRQFDAEEYFVIEANFMALSIYIYISKLSRRTLSVEKGSESIQMLAATWIESAEDTKPKKYKTELIRNDKKYKWCTKNVTTNQRGEFVRIA